MSNFQGTLSPKQAAENAFWLATLPEDGPTGVFFKIAVPCNGEVAQERQKNITGKRC